MQAVLVHPDGAGAGLYAPEARRFVAPGGGRGRRSRTRRPRRDGTPPDLRVDVPPSHARRPPGRLPGPRGSPRRSPIREARRRLRSRSSLPRLHPGPPRREAPGVRRRLGQALAGGRCSPTSRPSRRPAAEAFDGEDEAPMDPDALRDLPASEWARVRLVRASTFRLARVRPGAVDVLDAFLEERPLPALAGRGRVEVAFYRKDFVVLRRTLGPFDGCLLAALAAGETLGVGARDGGESVPRRGFPSAEILSGWFAEWASLGFFSGVERVGGENRPVTSGSASASNRRREGETSKERGRPVTEHRQRPRPPQAHDPEDRRHRRGVGGLFALFRFLPVGGWIDELQGLGRRAGDARRRRLRARVRRRVAGPGRAGGGDDAHRGRGFRVREGDDPRLPLVHARRHARLLSSPGRSSASEPPGWRRRAPDSPA